VKEIGMRTRPLSEAKDLISHSSTERAPTGQRATGAITKFYTILQVAKLAEVSTRTVRRWIEDGLLVAHRFGRPVRIAEHDLRAFLAQHRGR
jgi:excisionase family DNA binding protein